MEFKAKVKNMAAFAVLVLAFAGSPAAMSAPGPIEVRLAEAVAAAQAAYAKDESYAGLSPQSLEAKTGRSFSESDFAAYQGADEHIGAVGFDSKDCSAHLADASRALVEKRLARTTDAVVCENGRLMAKFWK